MSDDTTTSSTTPDRDPFPWEVDEVDDELRNRDADAGSGDHLVEVVRDLEHERAERILDESKAIAPLPRAIVDQLAASNLLDGIAKNPATLAVTAAATRDAVLAAVRERHDARRKAREERLGDDPLAETDLRREFIGAVQDADALRALGGAFVDGQHEAEQIAGELLDELPKRGTRARASISAADGHGFTVKLTRAKRQETRADLDVVAEILGTYLIATEGPDGAGAEETSSFAAGARLGIREVLKLIGSPKPKVTALDALATKLEDNDDDELVKRLRKAYGRVEVGAPSIKIDRKPITTDDDAEEAKA